MMHLSIAALKDLGLQQVDAIPAFLNGNLNEEVSIEKPLGYEQGAPAEWSCCLTKALYGLKQASRHWYAEIDMFLTDSLGLIKSPENEHFICSKHQWVSFSWQFTFDFYQLCVTTKRKRET